MLYLITMLIGDITNNPKWYMFCPGVICAIAFIIYFQYGIVLSAGEREGRERKIYITQITLMYWGGMGIGIVGAWLFKYDNHVVSFILISISGALTTIVFWKVFINMSKGAFTIESVKQILRDIRAIFKGYGNNKDKK